MRATDICMALYNLRLSANELLHIIEHACAPFAYCVALITKWNIVVAVKHLH